MKCTLCCFLQQLVDFTCFYRFFHRHAQVNCRHVYRRHPHGNRFKTVIKLRENTGDPCRQFGIHRNDRLAGRAGTPQIRMVGVNHLLVMHRRMNGGDGAGLNAIGIIEQFNDRNNAVGGAGGVGDNAVLGAELILIDAIDHRRVEIVAARMGEEHFLRTSLQMGFAVFATPIYAGTVEHHVYRQLAPRQRRNGRLV